MRMHVSLPTLGTLLDLPAGVSVVTVGSTDDQVILHLDGVDPGILDDGDDVVTAEYSVDAKGHRRFGRFKAPEPTADLTPPPQDPPADLTEDVGQVPPTATAKPGRRGGN